MTVVVGANNSGKSLFLREIKRDLYLSENIVTNHKVISSLHLNPLRKEDLMKIIYPDRSQRKLKPTPWLEALDQRDRIHSISQNERDNNAFRCCIKSLSTNNKNEYTGKYQKLVSARFLLKLDSSNRLAFVNPQPSEDILELYPKNHLIALFQNDGTREKIRKFAAKIFGKYFVIDPTGMTCLRVKMSSRPPQDSLEEQALNQRSRDFFKAAEPIESCSDGVKAFTGIMAAIFCDEFKSILINEPEAFLHPPLRRKLGQITN